jgi:hypothetical protein
MVIEKIPFRSVDLPVVAEPFTKGIKVRKLARPRGVSGKSLIGCYLPGEER